MTADDVVNRLDELMKQRGAPHFLRMDNGPEFVAHALNDWCRFNQPGLLFIDPGSPWQNGWTESFNIHEVNLVETHIGQTAMTWISSSRPTKSPGLRV
jgi:IS30 family transposase